MVYDGSKGPKMLKSYERDNKHPNHYDSTIRRSTRTFRSIRMGIGSGVPKTDPATCIAARWAYFLTVFSSVNWRYVPPGVVLRT